MIEHVRFDDHASLVGAHGTATLDHFFGEGASVHSANAMLGDEGFAEGVGAMLVVGVGEHHLSIAKITRLALINDIAAL